MWQRMLGISTRREPDLCDGRPVPTFCGRGSRGLGRLNWARKRTYRDRSGKRKVRPNPTLIPGVISEAWHSIGRRLSPFYFAGNRKVAHSVYQCDIQLLLHGPRKRGADQGDC